MEGKKTLVIDYKIFRKDTDSVMAHVLDNGKVEVHIPFAAPDQTAEDVVNRFLPDIQKQIRMREHAMAT